MICRKNRKQLFSAKTLDIVKISMIIYKNCLEFYLTELYFLRNYNTLYTQINKKLQNTRVCQQHGIASYEGMVKIAPDTKCVAVT